MTSVDQTGEKVKRCLELGIQDHSMIANVVGVPVDKLREKYPKELGIVKNGSSKPDLEVLNSWYSDRVKQCIRAGIYDHDHIANLLGISVKKLRQNFPVELGLTDTEDLINVAEVAYQMAVSGKFPHMTQWWLKCRGGYVWRENETIVDESEAPIKVIIGGKVEEVEEGEFSDIED
jgi:hypothetical protein